eukprot:8004342-Pyramimonas_sp.AAC.1
MAATYVHAKADNCLKNSHGYGPCETSQTSLLNYSLLGGRDSACGRVDPGMYFADEFAKGYFTGWAPVRAGRSCVVSATHMSYRTPDSDPCAPKDNSTNPRTS